MVRRDAFFEYLRGSLWFLPTIGLVIAVLLGELLSLVQLPADAPLAFQGTAEDARALLIGITGTMVTVIALLLGLAVVALQLSSTQFSPRLLRNFLRDRPNQIVLAVFVGTFAYSAAGLFTVGVSAGAREETFPRLAVTVAVLLLFVSLGLLVFFADHLAHSIQVDAIMRVAERNTLGVIRKAPPPEAPAPPMPADAVPLRTAESGYLQSISLQPLHGQCRRRAVCIQLRPMVGEHVVAGTILGWAWPSAPDGSAPDVAACEQMLREHVRIGFERTFEQDVGFGLRQLVDVACKALSAAINDPYTAIQAIDHLAVLFGTFAARPLGDLVIVDDASGATLSIPRRGFREHLALGFGLIRRFGAREPTVVQALVRLLHTCATLSIEDPARWTAIEREAELLIVAVEAQNHEPADLVPVYAEFATLRAALAARRAGLRPTADAAEAAPQ